MFLNVTKTHGTWYIFIQNIWQQWIGTHCTTTTNYEWKTIKNDYKVNFVFIVCGKHTENINNNGKQKQQKKIK